MKRLAARMRLAEPDCGRFGAHMPTQGGLHNAFKAGSDFRCDVVQLFTASPQQWKGREITADVQGQFAAARQEWGIPCVAAHANYLINPASRDPEILAKSRNALVAEARRCAALGVPALVTHLGSALGGDEDEALQLLVESVGLALAETSADGPFFLLETTAGQGNCLGHSFEHLATVLEGVEWSERVGVCLDTCHVFAAGYDLRTPEIYAATMSRFDELVGLERIALVHANDSKRELGSRVDRHEHIGQGHLGEEAFRNLLTDRRMLDVPVVLETPKCGDMDHANLATLRRLAQG